MSERAPAVKRRDKRAPFRLRFGQRAPMLPGRLGKMAPPTKRLEVRHLPRVAPGPERDHMIAFQPAGTAALPAPPPVPLEHGAAHLRPSARGQVGVVSARTAPEPTAEP